MRFIDMSACGPQARFCDADIYWVLWTVHTEGRISRAGLSERIGLGEGSIRSILRCLKDWNLVEVKQTGIHITEMGAEFIRLIPIRPFSIDIPKYVKGEVSQGILVRKATLELTNGVRQRNISVRFGSKGCTTFIIRKGRVLMLPDWDLDSKDPDAAQAIREAAEPSEGDVMIIGNADDIQSAMRGAVKAALDIL